MTDAAFSSLCSFSFDPFPAGVLSLKIPLMKYKLLTLLALAFAIPAIPQTPPQPADVGQDLKNLERKWTSALVLGDSKALSEILDDTYLDADELGNQTGKNGMIDLVKSGELK